MYEYQYGTDEDVSDYELLKRYFIKASHLGCGRGSFRVFDIYDRQAVSEIFHDNLENAAVYVEFAKAFIGISALQNNYVDNLGIIEMYKHTGTINSEKLLNSRR